MIDDAILCDAFDEQGSETVDGTDDVSNKSNCYNLVTCVKLWIYFENTCYLVKMQSLLTNI